MVTRGTVVGVLFVVGVCFSGNVQAGTNGWTHVSGGSGCFGASHASIGAVMSCIETQGSSGGIPVCDVYIDSGPSIWSGATWTVTISADQDNSLPRDCVAGITISSITQEWRFTDSCASLSQVFDEEVGQCVTPFDCSSALGVERDRFYSAAAAIAGGVCAAAPGSESDECAAEPVGFAACAGGECFARLRFTGAICGAEPDITSETLTDEPGNMNCVSGGGATVCAAQDSQNCGTVNGQAICLDSIPAGACAFLANGGMVCAASATAPPAPTDEMGMEPAMPDGEFSARSDDAVTPEDRDYFGPGTVAASGTATSGTASTGTTDEGDEEGEEGPCPELGDCEVAGPDLGETATFGEALGAFVTAVEGAPLLLAIGSIATSMPAGECPAPETEVEYLGGVELVLDAHCGLWDEIASVLTFVMLAVYVFLGARIVLSA